MSKLFKVVYEVAGIRSEYLRAHDDVLALSAGKLLRAFAKPLVGTQGAGTDRFDRLAQRLATTREALANLTDDDLAVRRGPEIQRALRAYVDALIETVETLKTIAELQQIAGANADIKQRLHACKVSYDDAVQYHKRLGARLNDLLATL